MPATPGRLRRSTPTAFLTNRTLVAIANALQLEAARPPTARQPFSALITTSCQV